MVRQPYSSAGEVQAKVIDPQVASQPHRRLCGVLICKTAKIRAIEGITTQDVCVADAGLDGFASHAHLGFCDEVAGKSKCVQEAARSNLVLAFQTSGIQHLEAIFGV